MTGVFRFDCYPSDFLNGIVGLTSDEIATYFVVIMLLYDRGEPVPYGEAKILHLEGRHATKTKHYQPYQNMNLHENNMNLHENALKKSGNINVNNGRVGPNGSESPLPSKKERGRAHTPDGDGKFEERASANGQAACGGKG